MAIDTYIKFGETPGDPDLPLIEGDSDDDSHFWWCELRDCDLHLEAAERSQEGSDKQGGKQSRPTLPTVTLKKRFDWASTQLFTKCCEAAEATNKKSDDDNGPGRIGQVTVHVCRQAEDKFTFLTVKYIGVQIVKYGIDVSGPEPSESLTLKFEHAEFSYQASDPETGQPKGAQVSARDLKNYKPGAQAAAASSSDSGSGGATPTPSSPGTGIGLPGGPGVVVAPPGTNGPAAEPELVTNFPGFWGGTGFGLLPD